MLVKRIGNFAALVFRSVALWILTAILALLVGCATVPVPIHPPASVVQDAWECIGGTGPAPAVQVFLQADLTCRNSPGEPMAGFGCGRAGFHMAPSMPSCLCEAGSEHNGEIKVARPGDPPVPWGKTTLPHEDLHELIRRSNPQGWDDQGHTDARFYTLVPVCAAKL